VIVRTVDKFKEHGGKEYIKKANLITIQHKDGTLGSYIHLDYKGVLVKVGDHVERGQLIGYSGLTGFTRGPHLHFVVHKQKSISVPVFFEGYENQILKKRKKYKIKK
jgi:murein DD-endopeptidase MepM/ murein hydrolase activator NlpD